jgi:hypothetical protein
MLQNAYFLAKIGADTAENEQHFAKICQKLATTLRVHPVGAGSGSALREQGGGADPAIKDVLEDVVARQTLLARLRLNS